MLIGKSNVADDGTGIVEMLFCTSLVALVGAGEHPAFSPRQLQIINTKVKIQHTNIILIRIGKKEEGWSGENIARQAYTLINCYLLETIDDM